MNISRLFYRTKSTERAEFVAIAAYLKGYISIFLVCCALIEEEMQVIYFNNAVVFV